MRPLLQLIPDHAPRLTAKRRATARVRRPGAAALSLVPFAAARRRGIDPAAVDAPGVDFALERARDAGGPEDSANYSCCCGYVFDAPVSTTVSCPHCGQSQAW